MTPADYIVYDCFTATTADVPELRTFTKDTGFRFQTPDEMKSVNDREMAAFWEDMRADPTLAK